VSVWPPAAVAAGQAADVAERAVGGLRSLIRAIAEDPAASARIALADTTVRIKLSDGSPYAPTLCFERESIELTEDADETEIELAMTALELEQLTRGELEVAMEIAEGRIAYSGPVRKFLRIVPILRRVSRDWLAEPDRAERS
jgi:hypothetical protein